MMAVNHLVMGLADQQIPERKEAIMAVFLVCCSLLFPEHHVFLSSTVSESVEEHNLQ